MAPRFLLPALCLVLVLAAGCGSSSGGSSQGAQTAPSPTATATTPTGPAHFTAAQFKQYNSDAAAFKKINISTLNRAAVCGKKINPPAGYLKKCVGTSLTQLSAATTKLGRTLAGYAGSVSGDCGSALNALINYVIPYEASIASLQNTVNTNNGAAEYNSVSSLKTARSGGQQKNAAVEQACAP